MMNSSLKKVSIIVPIYNVELYIERCIESLINQTYENLEIILVNDGSTDGSRSIVSSYCHCPNVKTVTKENGGLSSARNAGLKIASGDFIMFVDGDDYLEFDAVGKLMSHVADGTELLLFPYVREYGKESFKTPLFNMEYMEFDEKSVRSKIWAKLIGPGKEDRNVSPVNMDRLNTAWGKLYAQSLIQDSRFTDTQLIGPEDGWFNIQVLLNCKSAKYVSDVCYHYEKTNQDSLLHVYNENFMSKRWNLYKLISIFIREQGLKEYKLNLKRRIICEQYGLLQNIWCSNLKTNEKRVKTNEILKNSKYEKLYLNMKLSFIEPKWRVFYMLCKKRKGKYLELLFSGYLKWKALKK